MKKLSAVVFLSSFMAFSSTAYSESTEAYDPGFVVLDVLVYRPLGFVATLAGGAAFLGMSPLTAFASIPQPHDAFNKTFNALVLAPAAYTFVRPVGDRRLVGYGQEHTRRQLPATASTPTPTPITKNIVPTYKTSVPKVQQPVPATTQDDLLWSPNREKNR